MTEVITIDRPLLRWLTFDPLHPPLWQQPASFAWETARGPVRWLQKLRVGTDGSGGMGRFEFRVKFVITPVSVIPAKAGCTVGGNGISRAKTKT